MRFDRMTLKAQEALEESRELARTFGHPEIRPLHLVLALTRQPEGIVAPILEKLGADPRAVAAAASASSYEIGVGPSKKSVSIAAGLAVGARLRRRAYLRSRSGVFNRP